jgi:hypothetical protein
MLNATILPQPVLRTELVKVLVDFLGTRIDSGPPRPGLEGPRIVVARNVACTSTEMSVTLFVANQVSF